MYVSQFTQKMTFVNGDTVISSLLYTQFVELIIHLYMYVIPTHDIDIHIPYVPPLGLETLVVLPFIC